MKRVLNFRVVEGDPNEVDKNEILLVRDNLTGKIKNIKKRESNGELKDAIESSTEKHIIYDITEGLKNHCLAVCEYNSGGGYKVTDIIEFKK